MKEAIEFAYEKHKDQLDKGGKPYFGHVLRVALSVWHLGEDYFIAGLFHDLVEDCGVSIDYIRERWGDKVANAVWSVTRIEHPVKETYKVFVERSCQDEIGIEVKGADLDDNMRPERVACLPVEQQGVVQRYKRAKQRIAEYKAEKEKKLAEARHAQMLIDGGGA